MEVSKRFTFHAAHKDESAPAGDQCGRLHGHTYELSLTVATAQTNDRGMVLHGNVFKQFYKEMIEPKVEHQYLNDTLRFNPTMEAVCDWIARCFLAWLTDAYLNWGTFSVGVILWETPTMCAQVDLVSS